MRRSRRSSLGAWSLAEQQAVFTAFPEVQYLGFGYGNRPPRSMTQGLFGAAATMAWFARQYGRPPLKAFDDKDFDLSVYDAGQSPALERINAKLAAIDPRLPLYYGPTPNNTAGPGYSFGPDSPAYAGVGSSTITFNTPGGATTVQNGVAISGPGAAAPPAADRGGVGMALGLAAAGLAVIFLVKG